MAAEELHLTPSAISHGVQTLEEWLGTPLFVRGQRSLTLTDAGQRFLGLVQQAFAGLCEATEQIPGRRAGGVLSVNVPTSFASLWLLPRLGRFSDRYPDIEIAIDSSRRQRHSPLTGTDLAIRMATVPKAGGTWLRLFREAFVPVCAPALLVRCKEDTIEELLQRVPLLHVLTMAEDWDWWFTQSGIKPPRGVQSMKFDTIRLATDAASRGLGIAIGRKPLIDEEVAAGRLVEIGGPSRQGPTSYWLVGEEATFKRAEAKLFRSWLIDEMQRNAPPQSKS
jgi:DNA-binding transcriptional LysR family regulator